MRPPGLRARLGLALVAVAVAAVGLAALIGNMGLSSRLEQAARARLAAQAGHLADVAAAVYEGSGGWTPEARNELGHLAALDGLRLSLLLPDHRVVATGPAPAGNVARAPVVFHRRHLATASVSYVNGVLLSNQDHGLEGSLDRLHLVAAGVAAFAALVVGLANVPHGPPVRRENGDRPGSTRDFVPSGAPPRTPAQGDRACAASTMDGTWPAEMGTWLAATSLFLWSLL